MSRIPKFDPETGSGTYAAIARQAATQAIEGARGSQIARRWNAAERAAYQAMAQLPPNASTDEVYEFALDAACRATGRQVPLEPQAMNAATHEPDPRFLRVRHERAATVVLVLRRLGGSWVVEGDRPDGSGRFYETFPRFNQLTAFLRTLEYERNPPAN